MKQSFATNLITGLFLVVVVSAGIALLVFFQGYRMDQDGDVYYLVFDSAPKIRTSTPVEVSGRRVGRVEEVSIEQIKGGIEQNYALITQVVIQVRIESEFRQSLNFYSNAYAEVVPSLFGGSVISINPGGEGAGDPNVTGALVNLKPSPQRNLENTIPGAPTATINDVMEKANESAANVAEITAELRDLLTNEETRENLESALESITTTLREMSDLMTNEIRPVLENDLQPMAESARKMIENASAMVEENRENFEAITANVRTMTEKGAEFSENHLDDIGSNMKSVLEQMDQLTKTLNEIAIDNRGNIDQSMANLRRATQELSAMMTKLRRDPSIALWGTNAEDNAADVNPDAAAKKVDEKKLRESGHLPAQPRDE